MNNKRIKLIFVGTLLVLIISIGICIISLPKNETKKLYNSFFASIIKKQPDIKEVVENEEERKAEEAAKKKAEEEAKKKAAEQAAKKKAQEEATRKAEEENAKKKAQEEAKKKQTTNNNKTSKSNNTTKNNSASTNNTTSSSENKNDSSTSTTTVNCEKESTYQKQLLCYVNNERKKNGLNALTLDNNLNNAASIRAKEIKSSFSHTRPNGTNFSTAITNSYKSAGENIAAGQTSAKEVFEAWMDSDGHRKNILSSKYTKMGIALHKDNKSQYTYYWTQLFVG